MGDRLDEWRSVWMDGGLYGWIEVWMDGGSKKVSKRE